jgi:hypothetical protein
LVEVIKTDSTAKVDAQWSYIDAVIACFIDKLLPVQRTATPYQSEQNTKGDANSSADER